MAAHLWCCKILVCLYLVYQKMRQSFSYYLACNNFFCVWNWKNRDFNLSPTTTTHKFIKHWNDGRSKVVFESFCHLCNHLSHELLKSSSYIFIKVSRFAFLFPFNFISTLHFYGFHHDWKPIKGRTCQSGVDSYK